MKNSGIEWIGEIPEDWNLIKIGSVFQCRNEKVNDTDYPPLSVSKGGVVPQMESVAKTDANDNRKLVLKNDFVINSRSDRKQSCGLSVLDGSVSLINTVIYTIDEKIILPRYTDYLLKNYGFAEEFYRWGHGIVADLWTTRWQEMKNIVLPLLSVDEQQHIADYLDKKCAAVDRLMENQRLQIEKLKEYKQSLITEAVTKGLDKTVPLKSSGVEWIEDICKWFELRRLKEVAQILDEYRKPITADLRNQEADVLYDYYGASGVIDKIDGYTIDDHVMLIGEDGANLRMRNLPLMYEVKGKAWINNHAHILKPNADMNFYYLFYCLESLDINPYITGSAQPKLSQENLKNILLPVPPLSEQQQIAEYLNKKCAEIDELISIKQQKIEKLTEYKKSLIYEYVTGKKEVV